MFSRRQTDVMAWWYGDVTLWSDALRRGDVDGGGECLNVTCAGEGKVVW